MGRSRILHTAAKVTLELLILDGVCSRFDAGLPWPAYHENEPAHPDETVTLQDTAGRYFGSSHGEAHQSRGVQARVKAKSPASAGDKAEEVYAALAAAKGREVYVEAQKYLVWGYQMQGTPVPLKRRQPKNELDIVVVNALVIVEQTNAPTA